MGLWILLVVAVVWLLALSAGVAWLSMPARPTKPRPVRPVKPVEPGPASSDNAWRARQLMALEARFVAESADASLNAANRTRLRGRSGYRGVTKHKCGLWQAAICVRGERRYLGLHSSPEEAARAYDLAAVEAFGEYARPNFPVEVAS